MAEEKRGAELTLSEKILKRMMSGSTRGQMLREYCTPKMASIFMDKEMMSTVRCFFECDLNVSKTAELLFMHRNTLTYRLANIEKKTGIDLRQFDGACAFRILYTLYMPRGDNK